MNILKMKRIGYGTYQLSRNQETYDCVTSALNIGYTFIDTAALYKNELETFRAIKDYLVRSKVDRKQITVSSKIWLDEFQYDKLDKLKDIEYLDILYLHNPIREYKEKWEYMNKLDRTKVRKLGVSNFSLEQLQSLSPKPDAIQIEYFKLDQPIVDWCKNNNVEVYVHSCIRRFKLNTPYEDYKSNLQRCKTLGVIPIIGSKNTDYMQINHDLM